MPFPAFVEAGGVPEHLYLEALQWGLREQDWVLRLATCYARTAGLSVLRAFAGLNGGVDSHLKAIEGPRKIDFGEVVLCPLGGRPCPLHSHPRFTSPAYFPCSLS